MSSSIQKILLDTHIWIWLNLGSSELSQEVVKLIDSCAQNSQVYVSAISIWELSTLAAKKRLTLNMPLGSWVEKALAQPGVELLPLSPQISIESSLLPDSFHGDPADRLIVASARVENLFLVTRDKKIIEYAELGHVKIVAG